MAPALGLIGLVKQTVKDFLEDDCMDAAAALSYYTIFSLPAILVLLLTLISVVMNPTDVRGGLESQLQTMMGPNAGEQIRTIIQQAQNKPHGGFLPTILGFAGLLFGATGAFGQLQKTLNRTWNVEPDPNQGGFKSFITKRLFSFGMILVVAFFLLVSLVISAALTGMSGRLGSVLPSGLSGPLLEIFNTIVSLAVITALFAALFKVMPDAKKTKDRFFVGRIWVDDQDLQIVKAKGKAVPETKTNKFPIVETYREQTDGKFWFPTYVYAADDLIFDNGTDVRIRMRVKYTDYVIGRGKVTITELDEVKPENDPSNSNMFLSLDSTIL